LPLPESPWIKQCSSNVPSQTREFADAIAKSGPAVMTLPGVIASPGGLPIVSEGKIIGGIYVSGATGDLDEQCAMAGLTGM
jgi:glc operon protein GlcG